jgi:2-methylcitrate dehydratase PrpD
MAQAGTTLELLEQLDRLAADPGEKALDAARILAQDFLSVAVAGTATEEGRVITEHARSLGRTGPCHVVGVSDGFDAPTAALVTGTSGYSIGLTDTHARSITHPGPSVVPASLAIAELVGASGRDFLTAIVIGCEVVVRIGSVVNPSHRRRGYHPTATCNVFGVVASAAHLLGLDQVTTARALGLAGSMAGGLYEFRHEGSMLMALHAGWPAQNGILAADLAQRGFTGPTTVLEGSEGFFHAFADETDPSQLAVDLEHPGILEVGLRPYNACRYGHSGIDALKLIEQAHGRIDTTRVERMTVATHGTAVAQETEPDSAVGARLSTKFTVAYALAHGPKIDEVTDTDLSDPVVRDLIAKTDVVEDPELTRLFPEKWACRVRLDLDDGTSYEEQVDVPKGDPGNPMTPAEVKAKFHGLVEPEIGALAADRLESEFARIGDATDVAGLARALSGADA